MSDAGGVIGRKPATPEGVTIGATDTLKPRGNQQLGCRETNSRVLDWHHTTVADLDIDVGLFESLRLKLLPLHSAIGGVFIECHPPFKLVIGHGEHWVSSVEVCES